MTRLHTSWPARTVSGLAAVLLIVATLTGCTQASPDIGASAAKQLQASVLAVTKDASAGNIAGALAELATLEVKLREATASGAVSADRNARIEASIGLVRADLTAALPATSSPSPSPAATPSSQTGTNGSGSRGPKGTDSNQTESPTPNQSGPSRIGPNQKDKVPGKAGTGKKQDGK